MHQEQRDGRGRQPGNARRLSQRLRAARRCSHWRASFDSPLDRRVVDVRRQGAAPRGAAGGRSPRSGASGTPSTSPARRPAASPAPPAARRRASRAGARASAGATTVEIVVADLGTAQQLEGMRFALQAAARASRAARHPRRPGRTSTPTVARLRRDTASRLRSKNSQRSSSTSPSSRPRGVRRRSALSSRSNRRYSARLVNMR